MPGKSKKGGFAAEMEELLNSKAPKELQIEDDLMQKDDGDDEWDQQLQDAELSVPSKKGLRMRGALQGAFTQGKYKGEVVSADKAFDRFADEDEGDEEDEEEGGSDASLLEYEEDDTAGDDAVFKVVNKDGNINEAAISSKMDDIFAGLDDFGSDEEVEKPGETYEEFLRKERETASKKPRAFKRKAEDFESLDSDRLEGDDDEEEDIARQIAAISTATKQTTETAIQLVADEESKSIAARNQYHLWGKLVACRIHMQQAVNWSSRLPGFYCFEDFLQADPSLQPPLHSASESAASLIDTLQSLREGLLKQNPVMQSGSHLPIPKPETRRDKTGKPDLNKYWRLCVASSSMVSGRIDAVLDQWYEKAQLQTAQLTGDNVLKNSKDTSASAQVETTLRREESRLTSRTQKVRTGKLPFGHPATDGLPLDPKKRLLATPDLLQNPEIFDDSDFYSWLLTDYMHNSADSKATSAEELADAQRLAKDPGRLLIDKKRSKARKLNYEPNPKLIGFVAPVPQDYPPMLDALYSTLFASA